MKKILTAILSVTMIFSALTAATAEEAAKSADIIIVGAGGGGLSAAIEAVNDGAQSVIVLEKTGKNVEVMVYGDGAFKDPVGKIWELADPVVSPGFTDGLVGTPNELKLKYLADNDFANLSGAELKEAIAESIRSKEDNLVGKMASQGTTPRQLTDLIGSLCDLTSGSGDKGTPIILIQGYFDNFTTE